MVACAVFIRAGLDAELPLPFTGREVAVAVFSTDFTLMSVAESGVFAVAILVYFTEVIVDLVLTAWLPALPARLWGGELLWRRTHRAR